jgi:hypothetical protein
MTKRTRKLWTPEEIAELKRLHPNMPAKDIAKKLGRPVNSIQGMAGVLKLRKSAEYLKQKWQECGSDLQRHGACTRFVKGHSSWNKGMKGLHISGGEKGWFKKGGLPHNTLHDGAVRIRHGKTGHRGAKKPYYYIRISMANWQLLHVVMWEKANGPVPEKMRLWFKDNNSLNCTLENLELITEAEAMRRIHMRDEYVAMRLAQLGQKGKGQYDKKLAAELMKNPELIEAKRRQMMLAKTIKEKQNELR